jgi:hypothetical protein
MALEGPGTAEPAEFRDPLNRFPRPEGPFDREAHPPMRVPLAEANAHGPLEIPGEVSALAPGKPCRVGKA